LVEKKKILTQLEPWEKLMVKEKKEFSNKHNNYFFGLQPPPNFFDCGKKNNYFSSIINIKI
jgi:hypothetical protein